jgi:hypothetical protein
LGRSKPRLVVGYGKVRAERKEKAMIARFDHRPLLTMVLALTTAVLTVVVITLAALLITAAPPAATSSGESGAGNPGAVVVGTGEHYGEGWNNYGHTENPPVVSGAGGEHYGEGWNNYGHDTDRP